MLPDAVCTGTHLAGSVCLLMRTTRRLSVSGYDMKAAGTATPAMPRQHEQDLLI